MGRGDMLITHEATSFTVYTGDSKRFLVKAEGEKRQEKLRGKGGTGKQEERKCYIEGVG